MVSHFYHHSVPVCVLAYDAFITSLNMHVSQLQKLSEHKIEVATRLKTAPRDVTFQACLFVRAVEFAMHFLFVSFR